MMEDEEKEDILEQIKCEQLDTSEGNVSSKYLNIYQALPSFHKEAGIIDELENNDGRTAVQTTSNGSFLSRIGQLRLYFDENKIYIGTATVFQAQNDLFYAISCAHNFYHYHPINGTTKVKKAWFEGRGTNMNCYPVKCIWVHPKYDASKFNSPYDLVIICCKDLDNYFKNNLSRLMGLVSGMANPDDYPEDLVYIYGYPVSKKGQLWGMAGSKFDITASIKIDNLLTYGSIDTSPGQNGAPIFMTCTERREFSMNLLAAIVAFYVCIVSGLNKWGFPLNDSFNIGGVLIIIICFLLYKFLPRIQTNYIVGIHSRCHQEGHYGIKVSKQSLNWIKKCVDKKTNITPTNNTLYCLKDENFEIDK